MGCVYCEEFGDKDLCRCFYSGIKVGELPIVAQNYSSGKSWLNKAAVWDAVEQKMKLVDPGEVPWKNTP